MTNRILAGAGLSLLLLGGVAAGTAHIVPAAAAGARVSCAIRRRPRGEVAWGNAVQPRDLPWPCRKEKADAAKPVYVWKIR